MARRRVLTKLRIDELSAVDRPAQEGARALLMKRAVSKNGDYEEPPSVMTSNEDGHSHLVRLSGRAGSTSWGKSAGSDSGHDHPWLLQPDGTLLIGEAEGHSHTVDADQVLMALLTKREFSADEREALAESGAALPDGSYPIESEADLKNAIRAFGRAAEGKRAAVARHIRRRAKALGAEDLLPEEGALSAKAAASTEDDDMATKPNTPDLSAENAELKEKLAKAEALAALSPVEREYHDGLDEAGRVAFLKLAPEGRAAALAESQKADPVVYTDAAGVKYRRSDGEALISLAKRADAAQREAEAFKRQAEDAALEKRANELTALPGTVASKVAMLRALDSIPDESAREQALASLKAQNAEMAAAFRKFGTPLLPSGSDVPVSGRAAGESELDAIAKKIREAEPTLSPHQAMVKALNTPEGKAAYAKTVAVPVTH